MRKRVSDNCIRNSTHDDIIRIISVPTPLRNNSGTALHSYDCMYTIFYTSIYMDNCILQYGFAESRKNVRIIRTLAKIDFLF